jgi:hypothetical protein
MNRAIVVAFHRYTPFGFEYYEPILDFYLQQMRKFKDEYEKLYIIDSTWNIELTEEREFDKLKIIRVNPSLRYYDAYKDILPKIKEDFVLFMDNDMIVYKSGKIKGTFNLLEGKEYSGEGFTMYNQKYDVVSIYDTIGNFTSSKINGKSKFCPYWFATRKELLMKYLDCDWGDHMPEYETLGKLTQEMLKDNVVCFEWEEDKSNFLFGEIIEHGENGKNFGYYHIRSGSVPAYLLATRKYGDLKTYEDYMLNQPKTEYLRQFAWYWHMTNVNKKSWSLRADIFELLKDINIDEFSWLDYYEKFRNFHGL